MSALNYIAVEGPIGVGKTTLAERLVRDLDAQLLAERPDDNPYLDDFYADAEAFALKTQLSFLLQRSHQLDTLRQGDLFRHRWVSDFMFDKDRLFARLTLNDSDFELYDTLNQRLAWSAPQPDRVVYLHAPVSVLRERIEKRGRRCEQAITDEYLGRVSEAYHEFFRSYSRAPVVAIDAARLDLVNDRDDYTRLLDALGTPERNVSLPEAAAS